MAAPYRPIIAICGTTGVGKSKLAVDLALYVNHNCRRLGWQGAKIINADAMQVYKGLDVLTNKIPESERSGIPHLLMGFKQPGEQYVIGDWVQDAITQIDVMHKNNELPIIVGGTSYWIQHLIFPSQLMSKESSASKPQQQKLWSEDLERSIDALPSNLKDLLQNLPLEAPSAKAEPDKAFQMHQLLSRLDPIMSQRWHWKDTRKVLRSLEIVNETGRLPSSIIAEQSALVAGGNQPRFGTLAFWLYADPALLHGRLDARVDDMISQGLVDEVKTLYEAANFQQTTNSGCTTSADYALGIYQSIGYKEFCNYLNSPSDITFKNACERMKISTRQYAKRQISWIRNKLLPAIAVANTKERTVPLYLLDATTLGENWLLNVQSPAFGILQAFLDRRTLPDPHSLSVTASNLLKITQKDVNPTSVLHARKRRICNICTTQDNRPIMIEEGLEWDIHIKTRNHRRMARKSAQDYQPLFSRPNCDVESDSGSSI